ncbi:MAG: hypothetical protein L0Y75_05340 [Acidobacteria bacterium]|nr:hypothetical protein [Acidobacteriota bacterium]
MKIIHSAITSPVFELVKVIELDITLGDDFIPTRIEIFQDTKRRDFFRCRVWELEYFNLTPTFPMDENGKPLHISSDVVQVERSTSYCIFNNLSYDGFAATDADAALQKIIDDLKSFLEHVTGKKAKQTKPKRK